VIRQSTGVKLLAASTSFRNGKALAMILLAAGAYAQPAPNGLNRFQAFKGMTKQQALDATAKVNKVPKLLYAENFFVCPQVADGLQAGQGVWTTGFHIINLDTANSAPYELDFFTPAGAAASVGIVGQASSVSSLSGILLPKQEVTYVTTGLPATVEVYWAMLNTTASGAYVSLYEDINLFNAANNYLSSMASPSDFGVNNTSTNPGLFFAFDNTNEQYTTAAFANPDLTNYFDANTLQIQFLDSTGTLFDTETYTIPPGTQTAIVIANQWPKTANISGTMYIVPYAPASGSTAASFPAFSPITILGLESKSTQNATGFSHTDATVPLLTIGDYQ
jgi:hypothetical protein